MKTLYFFVLSILLSSAFSQSFGELRGAGKYTWFFIDVYEAKLYGPKVSDLYSKPFSLELKYMREFKGEDIVKQSEKELKSAGLEESIINKWRAPMLKIFPNVKEGDKITASFYPDKGVVFTLNTKNELGRIADLDFSRHFMNIWLGPKTSDPDLRDKLLGK